MVEERYTQKEQEYRARLLKASQEYGKMSVRSIGQFIENLSKKKPNKPALYFEDSSWTWGEFNEECNRYSNFFQNIGFKPQEVVAIILENCPEYLFICSGINKIQGVNALINTNQRKDALIHALNLAEPTYIIIDGKYVQYLNEIYETISVSKKNIYVINNPQNSPHEYTEIDDVIKKNSPVDPPTTINSKVTDYSFYKYTSGTTGLPKASRSRNAGIVVGLMCSCISQVNSEDISYLITPLYHNLGMAVVWNTTIWAGAAVVLKRKFSASSFWKDIQNYKVTYVAMIGEIPRFLLNQPVSELEKNHTLRKVVSLGLKKDLWMKFKERFQIEHIYETYAATESYGPFFNHDEIPGMVGRLDFFKGEGNHLLLKVDPDTQELIQEEDGSYQFCKPGDVGMVLNYIEFPEKYELYKSKSATQKKLLKGIILKNLDFENSEEVSEKISKRVYLMSGDLFKLHEDRWVSFADRIGDTFRWKGENVSTLEIENIIASYKNINLCAVYGVPIPNTDGKAGMAAIVNESSSGLDISSLLEFMNKTLPKYSIPIFIRGCDDLSLTGSYKLKKVKLRNEGYNIKEINDKIFLLDPKQKIYVELDGKKYDELLNGNFEK